MSDDDQQHLAIPPEDLDPEKALADGGVWTEQLKRWTVLHRTGMLPKHIKTPSQALLISLKGAEYFGWGAMRSLDSMFVVAGRVELTADAIHSLIKERCPEAAIEVVSSSPQGVTLKARRHAEDSWLEVSFSMDDAVRAGLDKGENWRKYPEDMCFARCISRLRRRKFPEVAAGCYVRGEIDTSKQDVNVEQVQAEVLDELAEG